MKKRLLIGLLAVGAIFSLASCKKEIYEVSFNSDGTVETIEVTENGYIVEPTAPTKISKTGTKFSHTSITGATILVKSSALIANINFFIIFFSFLFFINL